MALFFRRETLRVCNLGRYFWKVSFTALLYSTLHIELSFENVWMALFFHREALRFGNSDRYFAKVSLLFDLLCKITVGLIFENLYWEALRFCKMRKYFSKVSAIVSRFGSELTFEDFWRRFEPAEGQKSSIFSTPAER